MKRVGTSSPYSYYYYQNLWENFRAEVGESSKKAKKIAKARSKQVQRENVRSLCAICDSMTNNMMGSFEPLKGKEEEKREVVEENVVVIIDEEEEEKNEVVENKVVEKGEVVEDEKREVVENGEVVEADKGDEGGKVVLIDQGIEFDALVDGENNADGEGGEGNGDGGVVEEKNEDLLSSDIFGECDLLSGWEEWKFEVEQKWECSNPFWETENGAYSYWDVEAPANDWAESLWQF